MYKFDKIEIVGNGIIQLREVEVFTLEDGTTKQGVYRRRVFTPDMDVNNIDCDKSKAIASSLWTNEVIAAYKTSIE